MTESSTPKRSVSDVEQILADFPERQRREFGRRRARDAKPVKEIIVKLVTRHGLGRILASEELAESWRNIVGAQIAAHSQPGNLRRGVLEIHVTHSVFKQELQYQSQQILARLGQEAPVRSIRSLRFRVGTIH